MQPKQGQKAGSVHKITIPAHWNVTYGPPPGNHHTNFMQLRFYEGKKQRACIGGVQQFCDSLVQVEVSVEHEALAKVTGEPSDGLPF